MKGIAPFGTAIENDPGFIEGWGGGGYGCEGFGGIEGFGRVSHGGSDEIMDEGARD